MGKRVKLITPLPALGIDHSKPGEYVAARATTGAQNFRIWRQLIEKRPGFVTTGDPMGERIQAFFELDDGVTTHFVRIGNTGIEELNKNAFVWSSIAHAPLVGSDLDLISYAFPVLNGARIAVFTNGQNVIQKWTGTGLTSDLGGSPPRAKFVFFFGGYTLLMNVRDGGGFFPWRVQWCDTALPEVWTGGNAGSQDLLEDSKDITGPGYFGQYFTIHKEDSIYIGYPTSTSDIFRFERRDTGAGTVAHRTIQTLPTGEQFFLARDGFRLFNGNTAPLIDAPITEDIRDYLNPENMYKSWAKVVRELDEVWCGVPLGSNTEPSTVYKFNYVTRQMHIDIRPYVTAVGDYKNTAGQLPWDSLATTWDGWNGAWDDIRLLSLNPILVFGTLQGLTMRQTIDSSDNGTAIDANWDSKDFTSNDFGLDPGLLMEWQGAHVWARGSGQLQVYSSIDAGSSWQLAGVVNLASDYPADVDPQIAYFDRLNARCRIRLRHVGNDQTVQIKQFAMIGIPSAETDL